MNEKQIVDEELFETYEQLAPFTVLGRCVEAPEGNTLLRCFQFLSPQTISYGDFCWNRDCGNCRIWYEDETDGKERSALACRFRVRAGLIITRLDEHIEIEGVTDYDKRD